LKMANSTPNAFMQNLSSKAAEAAFAKLGA
jgi:hypothetical protein